MGQHLILDAAYPPSPQQWLADMNAVGADGALAYVWGPIVNYSVSHITTARQNGRLVVPVVVPGNDGPLWQNVYQRLLLLGFAEGPVLYDFEPGSEPTDTWWRQQRDEAIVSGYMPDRYGTTGVLGSYSPGDGDWIASWLRSGVLSPQPTLPVGWHAWQFVNDVAINGSQYDASVIDDAFAEGINSMAQVTLDPHDGFVQEARDRLHDIQSMLAAGGRTGTSFDVNGAPTYVDEPGWENYLRAALAGIAQPQVDASAVASALAANAAFVQAIATAVAHELGSALDKAP